MVLLRVPLQRIAELGRFSPLLPVYYDGVLVPACLRRLLKPKGAMLTVTEPNLHDSSAEKVSVSREPKLASQESRGTAQHSVPAAAAYRGVTAHANE